MCVIVQYSYECGHKHGIAWQERCGALKRVGRPCLAEGPAPVVNRVRDGSGPCRACKDGMEEEMSKKEAKQIKKEVKQELKEERRLRREGRQIRKDEFDIANVAMLRIDLNAEMARPKREELLKTVRAEVEAGRATVQLAGPEGKGHQGRLDNQVAVRPRRLQRKKDLSVILEEEEPPQLVARQKVDLNQVSFLWSDSEDSSGE